jgi:nitrogen regulatory protein PII
MVDRIVHALRDAGVERLTVTHVHAIGAGVDPAAVKMAFEEGSEYADKALVQFICPEEHAASYLALIERVGHTGRRGDGIVSIHPVVDVVNIRNGAHGLEALT